jgi:dihydrofolate reductase
MRKLTVWEHITLDGIVQAPGGPGEDGDYPYGGWAFPHRDPAIGKRVMGEPDEHYDLLLGRRTYDIWAGHWPKSPPNPMTDKLNAAKKYVVTHHPETLGWGPAVAMGPDVAGDVRRLRESEGPNLVLWGSSTVTPALLEHGLVDELVLLTCPVLLGVGKRLFAEGTPPRELELVDSQATASGVLINVYRAPKPLRTGSFAEGG